MIQSVKPLIQEHPFFSDLSASHLKFISSSAHSVEFPEGHCIFREGDPAKEFYAICDGLVAVELFVPGLGATALQTVGEGEVLGWSWITPPHRCHFHAKALRRTRAFVIDTDTLRAKCEEDHDLGYELLRRFADVIAARLDATRLQLLDIYARTS